MKKSTLFNAVCALLFMSLSINAQVEQKEMIMSHGPQNGYSQDHLDANEKHVSEAWKNLLKEYKGKVKKNRKSGEYEAFEVTIPMVSNQPLSVYLLVEEKENMSSSTVFVDDGTQYLDENNASEASANLNKLLIEFGHNVERLAVEDIIKEEEKTGKKFEKDLEKLETDNKKLHQDIEDYQNKIAQAELDIEKNLSEQDNKQVEIKAQTKLIEAVKDRLNNIGKN